MLPQIELNFLTSKLYLVANLVLASSCAESLEQACASSRNLLSRADSRVLYHCLPSKEDELKCALSETLFNSVRAQFQLDCGNSLLKKAVPNKQSPVYYYYPNNCLRDEGVLVDNSYRKE